MVQNNAAIILSPILPVEALNGGLFIARGRGGKHGERVIDSHELIYVQQGILSMREEDQEFVVKQGQTLLLKAGLRHSGIGDYPDDLRFYWIHFRLRGNEVSHGGDVEVPKHTTLMDPERLLILLRRFLDDQQSGAAWKVAADIMALEMLFEIARPVNRAALQGASLVPAQHADAYIRVHAPESISASDIAAALGYHPDYLGRVYKRAFGFSLTESLNRRRIHDAKQLLLDSLKDINQVAAACGFNDAEYFRRVFRKHENMTPGAYRRLYARIHVNSA